MLLLGPPNSPRKSPTEHNMRHLKREAENSGLNNQFSAGTSCDSGSGHLRLLLLEMGNDETLKDNRSSGCAPPSLADEDFAHDQVDSHVPSQSSGLMVNVYGC